MCRGGTPPACGRVAVRPPRGDPCMRRGFGPAAARRAVLAGGLLAMAAVAGWVGQHTAAVQSFQSVLVRARVDGTLDDVLFEEGQEVHPGDELANIDPRPYRAVLDQA